MAIKKPGRNIPDPAFTEDMLCSLALRIQEERKRSRDGRIDRRAVIRSFNEEFKGSGIELTAGVLAGIYLRRGRTKAGATSKQGNQASFVKKYLALHKERERAKAEAARAPAAMLPVPEAEPAPKLPEETVRETADQWSSVSRIAPQQFTPAHDDVIALAFVEWTEDKRGFRSPAALAAARINAARPGNRDPIANTYAIQDHIGHTGRVVPFLLAAAAFERRYRRLAPAKAQQVRAAIPPFQDAA